MNNSINRQKMDFWDAVPNETNDEFGSNKDFLFEAKNMDNGYTKINGFTERADGSIKRTKIDIYTTGFVGSHIRNAETGEYFRELVGSLGEDLYFSMRMSTGELKSKNGSNLLFYTSPNHCMSHLHIDISQEIINKWEMKRSTFKKGGAK